MRHRVLGFALTLFFASSVANARLVDGDTITIEEFDSTNISASNPPSPSWSFGYTAGQAATAIMYQGVDYGTISSSGKDITFDYTQDFATAALAGGTSCF